MTSSLQPAETKPTPKEEAPHPLVALVTKATGEEGSKSSILVYVVIIGVVILGFGIMGWLLVRAKRQAAALAYELRKKEEEAKKAIEDKSLAINEFEKAKASGEILRLGVEIVELKQRIEVTRKQAEERSKAVAEATSWKDLGL